MRLDVYLFENGYSGSRTEAKNLINEGWVFVNGARASKPAFDVGDADTVEVKHDRARYVSRGGLKLECAVKSFSFEIAGRRAIDIGASSGGFTDCLLRNGASSVIAVDSGTNQLVDAIRRDARVTVMESCNARYLTADSLPYTPELAVMDVSFISATYIIPSVYAILPEGGDFICLIKPQFEVGRAGVGKGGIVKDDKLRASAVDKVVSFAEGVGFRTVATVRSDVIGGDGNIEFLAHFKK